MIWKNPLNQYLSGVNSFRLVILSIIFIYGANSFRHRGLQIRYIFQFICFNLNIFFNLHLESKKNQPKLRSTLRQIVVPALKEIICTNGFQQFLDLQDQFMKEESSFLIFNFQQNILLNHLRYAQCLILPIFHMEASEPK